MPRRVLVIANNLRQASFRLRIEALIEPLARRGIALEVRLRPRGLLAKRALLSSAFSYDSVILQRKLLDPWEARLLRRHARRIFYDVDDAVMLHPRPVGVWTRWRDRRRFLATALVADRVVAGNEHLAAIFRERGCAVTVLPTTLDPARYRVREHAPADEVRLVWIGSRSTLGYLKGCLLTLEEAAHARPGLRLVTIADATVESSVLSIEHVPWSLEAEVEALGRSDIGLAPTPDDPWTRGKCGFKILQYMAAGLPVIASPVGANAALVRPGETGFLPESAEGWLEAIGRLAADHRLRARLGGAGRKAVEREYTVERAAEVWAGLLDGPTARG